MYLKRNKPKTYQISLGEPNPPSEMTIKYPFDDKSPQSIVKFIWLVHERKGLKPSLPFGAYVNHIKKFVSEVGEDRVISLIQKAAELSDHPFTIKFLRGLNEQSTD